MKSIGALRRFVERESRQYLKSKYLYEQDHNRCDQRRHCWNCISVLYVAHNALILSRLQNSWQDFIETKYELEKREEEKNEQI